MSDTNFHETLLSRLDRAERFYDGPIPGPLRRKIFHAKPAGPAAAIPAKTKPADAKTEEFRWRPRLDSNQQPPA